MSHWASVWAWEQKVGSQGAKMVLLAIAQFADEHAVGFPGQATLSETTEQGVRTVRRHLDFLEKRGLLVRTPRWRKDGTRTSDLYQLAGGQRPAAKLAGYEMANRPNSAGQPAKMTATPAAKLAGDPVRDPVRSIRPSYQQQPESEPRSAPDHRA